jgi:uncharacterized membrane protein
MTRKIPITLLAWCLALTGAYSVLSIVRHMHYESGGYDLGIYDQAVWQFSRFKAPLSSIEGKLLFSDHLALTLPLLAPLFWLWNDVRMLLIFQAGWLVFSSIAVYLLAIRKTASSVVALAISVSYSLFYGFQFMIFDDFHPVALGVGLVPWILYWVELRNRIGIGIGILLLLLTQENMGYTVMEIGVLYVWARKTRIFGFALLSTGLLWTGIALWLIEQFAGTPYMYKPAVFGGGLPPMSQLFDHPDKRISWLYTVTSLGFLPLFSVPALLVSVMELSPYFLGGENFARTWSPYMHYRAILAPFLAYGAIQGSVWLSKKIHPKVIALWILVATISLQFLYHLPLNKLSKSEFWRQQKWYTDNSTMISKIPRDMPIAANQSLVPHLSHRERIYVIWPRIHAKGSQCTQSDCWWLDVDSRAQYMLVDLHPNQWVTQLLESNAHVEEAIENMERSGVLSQTQSIGDIRLYKITHKDGN